MRTFSPNSEQLVGISDSAVNVRTHSKREPWPWPEIGFVVPKEVKFGVRAVFPLYRPAHLAGSAYANSFPGHSTEPGSVIMDSKMVKFDVRVPSFGSVP